MVASSDEQESETVKVELEIPKEKLQVQSKDSSDSSPKRDDKKPSSTAPTNLVKDTFEPIDAKSKAPATVHQRRVMVFGGMLIGMGLIILLFFSFIVGLSVAAAGSLVVAYGGLVRL
jgi:hypothetical protein